MKQKLNVNDFTRYMQEGQKWTWSICYDYTMASIINESKTEMILVGDSMGNVVLGMGSTIPVTVDMMIHHIKAVVKGAPNTFVVGDMPFASYNVSCEQAIISANRIMKEGGCDCVKLEGGATMADKIAAIVGAGIPVVGHVGLTPQTIGTLGGFKVQGATKAAADKIIADAKAVAEAGAFSICVECVPSVVAKKITETVKVPTLGIGAGPHCHCQELNLYDMCGLFGDFKPKFVKHYAQLRKPMVDALNQFYDETVGGTFPTPEYSYNVPVEDY
ncbi:MAG: 3-methyl-2-oxobutanoate hydroxymethyltransferase [Deltaproteobacteria bacterium]|jgi:3-methyl-2-oxobutanoate hydroxymethyltransferase|nr:3-methyl-2-oxobutanoate hydroxymethyltransferase [Deltaproteobacteria bacterium]